MKRMLAILLLGAFLPAACKRDDMADQLRMKPQRASPFFADGTSQRLPVPHTIDRDGLASGLETPVIATPRSAGNAFRWQQSAVPTTFPFKPTRADLVRGQERFTIYCSPCHGLLGDGDGMIPDRGFTRPPTFHTDRLRNAPPGYFVEVITNGIGAMFPYADRVSPEDRWRIAAYIRALQWSQHPPTDTAGTTQPGGVP